MFGPSSPLSSPIIKLRKFALSRGSHDSSDFEDTSANNSPIETSRPSSPAPSQRLASILSNEFLSPTQLRHAYLKHKSKADLECTDEARIISANYYKSADSELIRLYTSGDTDALHGSLILESNQEKRGSYMMNGLLPRKIIPSRPQRDGLISTFVPFMASNVSGCFHSMPDSLADAHITSTYPAPNPIKSLKFSLPLSFDSIVILAHTISSRPQRSVVPLHQKPSFTQLMWNGIQWLAGPGDSNAPVSALVSPEPNYSSAIFPPGVTTLSRYASTEAPNNLFSERSLGYNLDTDHTIYGRALHHSPISTPLSSNSPLSPEDGHQSYFNSNLKNQSPLHSYDQPITHKIETSTMVYPYTVTRPTQSPSSSGNDIVVNPNTAHFCVPDTAPLRATHPDGPSHSPVHFQVDTATPSPLCSPVDNNITSGNNMEYVKDNFGRELRDFHYEIIQRQKKSDRNNKMHSLRQERMQKDTEDRNRVIAERLESMAPLSQEKERLAKKVAEMDEQLKNARIREGEPNAYTGQSPTQDDRREYVQEK